MKFILSLILLTAPSFSSHASCKCDMRRSQCKESKANCAKDPHVICTCDPKWGQKGHDRVKVEKTPAPKPSETPQE